MSKRVYTIGHSTRSLEEFLDLLKENEIAILADIRSGPSSRKFPHFNRDSLSAALGKAGNECQQRDTIPKSRKLTHLRKPGILSACASWRS